MSQILYLRRYGVRCLSINYALLQLVPIILAVRTFLLVFMVKYLFGDSGVGLWSKLVLFSSLVYMVSNLGIYQSMNRFFPSPGFLESKFHSCILLYVLIFSVLSASVFSVGFYYFPFFLKDLGVFGSALLVAFCLSEVLFIGCYTYFRSKGYARLQIAMHLFRFVFEVLGVAAIFFLYSAISTKTIVSLIVISGFTVSIVTLLYIVLRENVVFYIPRRFEFLSFFSFGFLMLASSLGFWLVNAVDRFLIDIFLGLEELGSFFFTSRFSFTITFLVSPFHAIYHRVFASGNSQRCIELLYRFFLGTFVYATVLYLVVVLLVKSGYFSIFSNLDLYLLSVLCLAHSSLAVFMAFNSASSVFCKKVDVVFHWFVVISVYSVFAFFTISVFGLYSLAYGLFLGCVSGTYLSYTRLRDALERPL